MKKFLSIVLSASLMLLLVGNVAMAKSNGEITLVGKMGMDLMGKYVMDDYTKDIDNNFSAAGECFYSITPELAIGAGVEYLPEREIGNLTVPIINLQLLATKYSAIPIYGAIKYNLPMQSDYGLFLTGKVGYNIANLKYSSIGGSGELETKNGVCFGGGIGFVYDKMFLVELNYSLYNFAYKAGSDQVDASYSKLTLSGGINFSL